jgi:hypothetical protein
MTVFEVMAAGRPSTVYGADANSLQRAGPPKDLETTLGGTIAWSSGAEMPERLQIVSAAGEAVATFAFKECGDLPKQQDRPQRAPQPPAAGPRASAPAKPRPESEPSPQRDSKPTAVQKPAAASRPTPAPNRAAPSQGSRRPPPPAASSEADAPEAEEQ